MPLDRILEPEVMDSADDARDYDAMDHGEVNRRFVKDLLESIQGSGFGIQGSEAAEPVLSTEYSVLSTQPAAPIVTAPDPKSPIPNPQFADILDLGAGTALIPIELCRRFAGCRVMAVDAAVNMLDLARYNIEIAGLTQRIELAHVDAKQLPFRETLFDVVMSNSIIHHIPEPRGVLAEAVRVTRPGGLLFFRDLLRPESEQQLQQLVDTYTAGANDHQRHLFAESLHAALSLDEIRGLITTLGFAPNGVQPSSDRHWTWAAIKR